MINQDYFLTNSHSNGFTISYLDPKLHKIALSEISYLPHELVADGIMENKLNHVNHLDLPNIISDLNTSEIAAFYSRLNVPPALQNIGLGTLLLKKTLEFCKENDIFLFNTINAYGTLEHDQLLSFYEKNGMTIIHKEGSLIYSPKEKLVEQALVKKNKP